MFDHKATKMPICAGESIHRSVSSRLLVLLSQGGRQAVQTLAIVAPTILRQHLFPLRACPTRQRLPILLEFHQRHSIPARGLDQINRGQDDLSDTAIAWEMGQQFIPALCSWQNGLSLSIEAHNLGGSTKRAEQKRNAPVFSQ